MRTRLYTAEKQHTFIQDFESIALIISAALGGKAEEDKPPIPKTKEELAGMMASVFGRKQ